MTTDNGNGKAGWHLSPLIQLGVIGGLIVNTFFLGWGASSFDKRIEGNREDLQIMFRRINEHKTTREQNDFRQWDRIRTADQKAAAIDKEVSNLSIKVDGIQRDVSRLLEIVDRRASNDVPTPQ